MPASAFGRFPLNYRQVLDLLTRTTSKNARRLLPFLLTMYIMAFLDRSNLGFAKNAFQLDTGLSDAMYAFGAGIFFIGYSIFEIPSNLIMHRVGAKKWMFRIMVSWGLISSLMMFAHNEITFYVLRFLLGAAEAGFFPGVIYYLTYWFPSRMRARSVGIFYFGIPLSLILGGPLSGYLLEFEGYAGLQGWQWMFLVEGLMAVVVGFWAYWYLDSKPEDAKWLTVEEKEVLTSALRLEQTSREAHSPSTVLKTLGDKKVLYLCAVYFLIQICLYGVVYYLPSQIATLLGKKIGLTVGLVTTIPWLCALLAAWLIPHAADKTGKTRLIAALTLFIGGVGIALSISSNSPEGAIAGMCVATAGIIAVQPVFWTFPTRYLSGVSAAGGIAFVNSVGTLGGFVAPNIKNFVEESFASASAGLMVLAISAWAGSLLIYLGRKAVG